MGVKLLRVELHNIRSHKHVIFTPELEGITALSGPIGSGKSTIVDSIAWSLYGTKPDGVSKNNEIYRSDGDFKKDKASALVTFEIDGRISEVERRITTKTGSVECDVWSYLTKDEIAASKKELKTSSAEDNEDLSNITAAELRLSSDVPKHISELIENSENLVRVHIAGSSPSHSGKEIRRIMGMDEKGFLAAILVQQKQVDTLISPRTKDRAKIIEDLTGISSITTALMESRTEANTLKKMASLSNASENSLKEATRNRENLQKDHDKCEKTRTTLETKLAKSKKAHNEIKIDFNEKNEIFDKTETIQTRLSKIDAKLEVSESNFEYELKEKDEKKKQLKKLPESGDFSKIENQMDDITEKLYDANNSLTYNKEMKNELLNENRKSLSFVEKSKVKTIDECTTKRETVINQISSMESKLENLKNSKIEQKNDIKKFDKAISILTQGDGTCPTCLQHVSAVDVAVKSLNSEKKSSLEKIEEIDTNISTITKKIIASESIIEKYDELLSHLVIVDEFSEKEKASNKETKELETSINIIEIEFKAIQKTYRNAKQASELKEEYQRLLDKAKATSDEIEKLKKLQISGKKKLEEIGSVSQTQLSKVRAKYQESSEVFNNDSEKFSEIDTEYKVLKEKVYHAQHLVSEETEKLKNHKELLEKVEISTYTTKTIEEFREDRIKKAVPTIEAYASDFISRFTEGRFIRMKMNEKFETKVVLADGTERSVGLLSGGELSAAAMALRLAISLLISGDSSENLIILDEVLVSQDAVSAEIILSTIKEVCKGQVVLIAHNAAVEAIVDKTVLLGQDEKA